MRNHLAKEAYPTRPPPGISSCSIPFVFPSLLEERIKSLLIKFVDDIKVKNNKDSLVLLAELNYLIRLDFSERNPF